MLEIMLFSVSYSVCKLHIPQLLCTFRSSREKKKKNDMYPCYVCYVYAYACHVGSLCAIRMYYVDYVHMQTATAFKSMH